MDCRSLCARRMGGVAHRVYTACVYPAVVKVEQRTNSNGIVDRLICVAFRMKSFNVLRLNGMRLMIHLANESQQGFLRFRHQSGIQIGKYAINNFFAAEQFRRDRGVRFRSKRALVQA